MNMTRIRRIALLGALCAGTWLGTASLAQAMDRIEWRHEPITVLLGVDVERRISFPSPVKVGLPANVNEVLRTQIVDNTVYWKATAPFTVTRVSVQDIASGQIILIDVKANKSGGSSEPIEVRLATDEATQNETADAEKVVARPVTLAGLTRFAAQQSFAPSRLLREMPGIWRVRLGSSRPVRLVGGKHAGAIEAVPLAAWRSRDYYVTTVRLRNVTATPLTFDPRTLRGQWITATPQHGRLGATGDDADTTAVYLISARPFEESL